MLLDADWCWLILVDSDWCWLVLNSSALAESAICPKLTINERTKNMFQWSTVKMLWHQAALEQAYKAVKMCQLIKLGRPLSIIFKHPLIYWQGSASPTATDVTENTVCVWSLLAASLVTAAAGGSLSLLLLLDRPLKTLTLWRRAASGQRVIGASLAFQIKAFRHTAIKSFLHFDNPQYAQMMKLNSS